jgi:hypothetical protein
MVIKTASPGVIVNEVDLTRGTSDGITTNVGGIVGPFAKGPVDELILIETEAELQKTFGDPTSENAEYWYTVANFLEYGGVCYVVRCNDLTAQTMKNAVDTGTAPYIRNQTDFDENYYLSAGSTSHFVSRNPGTWGNAIGVSVIDAGADWIYNLSTTGKLNLSTGQAAADTVTFSTSVEPGQQTSVYNQVKAAAFAEPTPWAAVQLRSTTNVSALTGEQSVDGVTTSTSRVLLTAQTDASENGIYVTASGAWARAADADASSEFEFAKKVNVTAGTAGASQNWYYTSADGPTIGTTDLVFSMTNPAPASIGLGDIVKLGAPTGSPSPVPTGVVSAIDTTNSVYTILVTAGNNFVDNCAIGTSFLQKGDGTELSAPITAAEGYFNTTMYEAYSAAYANRINIINNPKQYTVAEGTSAFGWTSKPTPGLVVTSGTNTSYVYSSVDSKWNAVFVPGATFRVSDGSTVFTLTSAADWYSQQVALEGIPWYRFAPRPTTTLNAIARGAKNDAMNIIVYDATGDLTGSKGNTLEQYIGVSKLSGALTPEGDKNFYEEVINTRSQFVYANQPVTWAAVSTTLNAGRSAVGIKIGNDIVAGYIQEKDYLLTGGVDNLSVTLGERQVAYNKFATENVSDLDYLLQGPAGANLADSTAIGNFLINICEERRDCMAFLSPPRSYVIGQSDSEIVTNSVVTWADTLTSSSYAVFDSGYKYTFDRFNDVYRYIPLNGDTAGTLVFTAIEAEPYYSPAGVSRGQIRNVVKLPYNPSKAQRDVLYSARINPVVTFPGEGTVLFGDKTALGYSSAFDRINVRRLFLIVEKEIAEISRVNLFEFNDDVTRTLFKNNVNPFLRDIQSKRGMYDFLVVCDVTNNSPEIIDRNEFVADIYIKPAKSINFITLNFIATKTGATFDESVGLFRGTTSTTGA